MRGLPALFWRAFLMVSLVALNTTQIAHGRYSGAFLCGMAISYVWYRNVGRASRDERPVAAVAYAMGAACGTVLGMWVGR